MLKTLSLAIALVATTAAAAPAHADWPINSNGTSFNASQPNTSQLNAVEAHAALNGRVIGIELPPTSGEVHYRRWLRHNARDGHLRRPSPWRQSRLSVKSAPASPEAHFRHSRARGNPGI